MSVDLETKSALLLFYSLLFTVHCELIQMIPDEKDQVIEVNSTLTLTCISEWGEQNISWILPDYLSYFPQESNADKRLQITYGDNGTHLITTMTLLKATMNDSGEFGCAGSDKFNVSQDITVLSYMDMVYMENEENPTKIYMSEQGEVLHIPCKKKHPKVNVLLRFTDAPKEKTKDLLSDPDSTWSYSEEHGLTLGNSKISDSGYYQCVGVINNARNPITEKTFRIFVKGIELSRTGGPEDPLEGTNVTLKCIIHTDGESKIQPGYPLQARWYYRMNDTGAMQIINETNPPKGIQWKRDYEERLSRKSYVDYTSQLDVINISISNAYTNFKCKSNISSQQTLSTMFSFSIRVLLEKSRPKNLICIKSHKDFFFNWLKDGKDYSGQVYQNEDMSTLTLEGISSESGNYSCQWNSSKGEARYRNFTVTFTEGTLSDMSNIHATITAFAITLSVLMVLGIGVSVKLYSDLKKQVFPAAKKLLDGNLKELNPQLSMEEQTDLIPYDKGWEFPRCRLTLGIQLGAGCFGRVVKAEAVGLKGSSETVKTVAVKMVRSQTNAAAMESLVAELKILIHLGSHLNVVNLLGACTKKITKGELLIIVEYCRYGNLQTYLSKHRNSFISLLDDNGNMKTDSEIAELKASVLPGIPSSGRNSVALSGRSSQCSNHYKGTEWWHNNHLQEPDATLNKIISTRDLISWSFQIARGMEYLSSKKVLHGDLAARNILLADDGVVKVADFGMSKKMYYESNYERKEGLMPVKWMAIESLTNRIFSTQSDVWSYGVLLWELFTLGEVPYPGMDIGHLLVKEIKSGYRMEKPDNAPNFFGVIMTSCWETLPNERPTFQQLEEMINNHMESSVSCHYLNLTIPYGTFDVEEELQDNSEIPAENQFQQELERHTELLKGNELT